MLGCIEDISGEEAEWAVVVGVVGVMEISGVYQKRSPILFLQEARVKVVMLW